jgi:general secretion pathway protein B
MSYILDALKKSEQERGHGNVPGVQTVHSSSLSYRSDKKALWPYILIAAVILNLLAILYFIVNRDNPSTDNAETRTRQTLATTEVQPAVVNEIEAQRTQTIPAVKNQNTTLQPVTIELRDAAPAAADNTVTKKIAPAGFAADSEQQQAKTSNTKTATNTAQEKVAPIEFYDLPETIKKQLPAIVISAHVYSTNPLQRSIVINDKFLEEGEYVIDDLILKEITADGAIFDYQGTRFHYGVVSSWQ